jgi:phage N-6-adenine-methyltransferase
VSDMAVHFSSKTDEWATPPAFFADMDREFHFTLDVCATADNAKCAKFYTFHDNGLLQVWAGVVWCNPPYGAGIEKWVRKGYMAAQAGATVVMLVPARTDTRWFHEYCQHGEVRFIKGRLKFGGHANSAPFPSMVVIFRPQTEEQQ